MLCDIMHVMGEHTETTHRPPYPALHAARAAFPTTIPVLLGYLFVGIAFGVVLRAQGYGLPWAALMSLCIYAGSMQFVAVALLSAGVSPAVAAVTTLLVNFRHLFYGLTMLERFAPLDRWRKGYMIFALTDETYSLYCGSRAPAGVDERWFLFWVALMDQSYWVIGSCIGSLAGSVLPFSTQGIDFAMTALFAVMLLEQLRAAGAALPAIIGAVAAAACLLAFGPQNFLLPSMLVMTAVLIALRPKLLANVTTEAPCE